jgi:hypothetical protein
VRLSKNQALFREVNERVKKISDEFTTYGPMSFVCECSHTDCDTQLELSPEEYEQVRARPTHFLIAPGHEISDIEVVVDVRGDYAVVEKVEAGGAFAAATWPRRET